MMQMEQARRSEEEKMMMDRMQRQEETLRKRQEENNLFMQAQVGLGLRFTLSSSVLRIRDAGSDAFFTLDPGSGIGWFRISDPRSQTIFLIAYDKFLGKKYYHSKCFG